MYFFELAAEALDEPYFGLKWVQSMPPHYPSSGATIFLVFVARNLERFLDMVVEYQGNRTNGIVFSYDANKETNKVTGYYDVHPYVSPHRQFSEHVMALIAVIGRLYIDDFKVGHVAFQHSAPEDMTVYNEVFDCPVEFNAKRNRVIINYKYFRRGSDPTLMKLCAPVVKSYIKIFARNAPRGPNPISTEVAQILPPMFGVSSTDVQSISASLGLHPKKLQRLLKEEGTSYSDVLDEVRRRMASRLLVESDIPIGHVAKMLDYSSGRALGMATKRWFNQSPRAYRRRQQNSLTEINRSD